MYFGRLINPITGSATDFLCCGRKKDTKQTSNTINHDIHMCINEDKRLFFPAVSRNRDAIRTVFLDIAPQTGEILELACGSGEHAVHIAAALPGVIWHPTDLDSDNMASIDAHATVSGLTNVRPASKLDVRDPDWPFQGMTGIFNANMIHISPWDCTIGLMAGAGRALTKNGFLFMYGPYKRGNAHTAPSNQSFDESLQSQNPQWGVRNLEDVSGEAEKNGMILEKIIEMPANNLSVIYRRI